MATKKKPTKKKAAKRVTLRPEPIEQIVWFNYKKLKPNDYNPNWVMPAEMDLLEHSLLTLGWIQPIVVGKDLTIIDGFHRWLLAHKSKAMLETYGGKLPCVVLDLPRWKALCMTVRINRAKGMHGAQEMAKIVKELVDICGMDKQTMVTEMGMTMTEIDALYSESVFKARNTKAHKYSKAWIPEEVKSVKA